MDKKPTA